MHNKSKKRDAKNSIEFFHILFFVIVFLVSVIVLIENIVENEYNIPMNDSFGEEVQQMCNLSEGIEQRGIEKGIQQGTRQMVLNALQSNSIEDVSKILLLPIKEVEKIANEK